jgi:dTMP kinase
MDLELSRNIVESFRLFQGRILEEYDAMAAEMGFHVIDATGSIEQQQRTMRGIVTKAFGPSIRSGLLRAPEGIPNDSETAAAILR